MVLVKSSECFSAITAVTHAFKALDGQAAFLAPIQGNRVQRQWMSCSASGGVGGGGRAGNKGQAKKNPDSS